MQTVATVRVRFPFSRCAGPDSGAGAICYNTIPVRPGSKRTGSGRIIEPKPEPEPGPGPRAPGSGTDVSRSPLAAARVHDFS